ncbi:MAG: hypothetical protein RI907_1821 [Pseudomonadota bacterium]|jgi:hypothetical protein
MRLRFAPIAIALALTSATSAALATTATFTVSGPVSDVFGPWDSALGALNNSPSLLGVLQQVGSRGQQLTASITIDTAQWAISATPAFEDADSAFWYISPKAGVTPTATVSLNVPDTQTAYTFTGSAPTLDYSFSQANRNQTWQGPTSTLALNFGTAPTADGDRSYRLDLSFTVPLTRPTGDLDAAIGSFAGANVQAWAGITVIDKACLSASVSSCGSINLSPLQGAITLAAVSSVPEPSNLALLLAGMGVLGASAALRRR